VLRGLSLVRMPAALSLRQLVSGITGGGEEEEEQRQQEQERDYICQKLHAPGLRRDVSDVYWYTFL